MIRLFTTLIFFIVFASNVLSDEIRPSYLHLKETTPNIFKVLWKVPSKGEKKLGINVDLPVNCKDRRNTNVELINNAYIERWMVSCDGGLLNKQISIEGLNSTSTDVLLHMEFADGRSESAHLTPANSTYVVPAQSSSFQVASTYTWLGIEHILIGIDHLLFVFALLLIVQGWRRLLMTITAFTIAHSITLVAATLGFVSVPQQPVEAVIALSILFLAMEYVRGQHGKVGATVRWPWLIAFIFGLLHGFGFAGALAEVGLPSDSIPLALIFFNVGVELGQLIFISIVFVLGSMLELLKKPRALVHVKSVTIYVIGGLSAFWLIERVAAY